MKRQDVLKLATDISAKINGKLNTELLYSFFLDVCKEEKISPAGLKPHVDKNWIKAGNHSAISVEPVQFNFSVKNAWATAEGYTDYEELILARQEAETLYS